MASTLGMQVLFAALSVVTLAAAALGAPALKPGALKPAAPRVAPGSLKIDPALLAPGKLHGFADLHTHPMSHLGFGRKAMHGAPDVGILLPGQTARGCGSGDTRPRNIEEALGNCNATHGGWGAGDNPCGDHLRAGVINNALDSHFWHIVGVERNAHNDHPHAGYPAFEHWPHHSTILHQQMWWEWIKRAHEGGLRVIVALTVNNETLAEVLNGARPYDDKSVADLQIDETVRMVESHRDFMEIARSAADAERIVRENRLAVILGMEIDKIGNFGRAGVRTNEAAVVTEIRRLHGKGIRYVFPIHLIDNAFGGTAVYKMLMNMANRNQNGSFYSVMHSPDANVSYQANFVSGDPGVDSVASHGFYALLGAFGFLPAPCFDITNGCLPGTWKCCGSYSKTMNILTPTFDFEAYKRIPVGHVNSKGLTQLGEAAVREMMRLGMLVDVDHMSELALRRTVEMAEGVRGGYPLVMGHNGLRERGGNERGAPRDVVKRIAALGGMMGAGTAEANPGNFIISYKKTLAALREGAGTAGLGLGTDANGFEQLPHRGAAHGAESRDRVVTVPGDAWNHPPAALTCGVGEQIDVRSARIGCLDIQRNANLTPFVALSCNGRQKCNFKAPTQGEYQSRGVQAATRDHCTQAMEIVHRCSKDRPADATTSANFYASFFRDSGISTKQRKPNGGEWDYIADGGVSHYGLLPEFLHEVKQNDASVYADVMSSADAFVQMWKKADTVKSAVGAGPAPGTFTYSFEPVRGLCPNKQAAGDGEFSGHGPQVKGRVGLSIDPSGTRLQATLEFSARETTADWSEVKGTWTVDIGEPAPAGLRYTSITGPRMGTFDQVLVGGGRNEVFEGCDGGEHWVPVKAGAVDFARLVVVGDTGGGDISGDADCNCDTRIVSLEILPVRLTTARR